MSRLGAGEPTGHRDAVFGWWERDGRVLLVRNPRVVRGRLESAWDLPGGAVRSGEGLAAALAREWQEEVGLAVRPGALFLVADGAKRRREGGAPLYTWRAFLFLAAAEGDPRAGEGIEEVAWVARDDVIRRLDQPYHAPLHRWIRTGQGGHAQVDWIEPHEGGPDAPTAPAADRLRRLLAIAAAAAAGETALVAREVEAAVADGESPLRIEEALLQGVPYAGFPRTIAAFGAARGRLGAPSAARGGGDQASGPETFGRVYGETAPRVEEGLGRLHPELRAWTLSFAYGRVLSRPVLTLLERELLAVSLLTALGRLEDPLLGHMRAAVRLGASPSDVRAAIAAVPHALGEAKREAAFLLLGRL